MNLRDKLLSENIDPLKLEKGLKLIGLKISQFDSIQEESTPYLLELFRIAMDIQPTSTKLMKMDVRLKLEKVLKAPFSYNINTFVPNNNFTKNENINNLKFKFDNNISKLQRETQLNLSNKKIGKVKFFDSTKGFGYINSFTDKKDCFVHASKLITSSIDQDDIVIFETVALF